METEWLDFGHKFGERCGHGVGAGDSNERCPVFLQWLDAVHQLLRQFPCSFEFNEAFLVRFIFATEKNGMFGGHVCRTSEISVFVFVEFLGLAATADSQPLFLFCR